MLVARVDRGAVFSVLAELRRHRLGLWISHRRGSFFHRASIGSTAVHRLRFLPFATRFVDGFATWLVGRPNWLAAHALRSRLPALSFHHRCIEDRRCLAARENALAHS